jgi:hypothetical protein
MLLGKIVIYVTEENPRPIVCIVVGVKDSRTVELKGFESGSLGLAGFYTKEARRGFGPGTWNHPEVIPQDEHGRPDYSGVDEGLF